MKPRPQREAPRPPPQRARGFPFKPQRPETGLRNMMEAVGPLIGHQDPQMGGMIAAAAAFGFQYARNSASGVRGGAPTFGSKVAALPAFQTPSAQSWTNGAMRIAKKGRKQSTQASMQRKAEMPMPELVDAQAVIQAGHRPQTTDDDDDVGKEPSAKRRKL
jgi:hypothetical protein